MDWTRAWGDHTVAPMTSHRSSITLLLAAGAAGLALAGCGDSGTSSASASSSSGSGTSSPPTATIKTISGPQQVTPTGDVPVGKTATFTGTIFDGGKSYDAPLRVGVSAITKGSPSDLASFDFDGKDAGATPYYVKASFRNLSTDKTWDPTGMPGALAVTSKSGKPVGRITLVGSFPKCEDDRPKTLGPGETVRTCTVLLVPKGDTLERVSHADAAAKDYVWKAS